MKSARLEAFEILNAVFKNGAYSNISLDKISASYSKEDRAFITNIVLGVIERRITLDYIISKFTDKAPKNKVKILLYIGLYQLYFMEKVPSSAAVNETVKLCGEVGCEYYKKLVNAVLRNADKNRLDINKFEDISVKYSCPEHLINMLSKMYGKEKIKSFLEVINTPADIFAVPNILYCSAEELWYELESEGVNAEINGSAVKITDGINLNKSNSFKNGLFHIEDLSSYNCAAALGAKENDTVLDMCSAPGGKAFTIAESMNNTGCVYAFDIHEHRVKLIEDGAKRLGLTNIKAAVNDALKYTSKIPKADKILCDVPCSGFGIIRRKPEIRYKNLDSIKELPEIQYNILSVSSEYLKTGGRIMYSTCTLNKRENEKVVSRFLDENKNFELIKETTVFPSCDGGDGFYWALMEKKND